MRHGPPALVWFAGLLLAGCSILGPPPDPAGPTLILVHQDTVYRADGLLRHDSAPRGALRWLTLLAGPDAGPGAAGGTLALAADNAEPGRALWLSRPLARGLEHWRQAPAGWQRSRFAEDLPAPVLLAASADGARLALAWNDPPALVVCDRYGTQRRTLALPPAWQRLSALAWLQDGSVVVAEAEGRLARYTAAGLLAVELQSLGIHPLRGPVDLCPDDAGGLWLLDAYAGSVWPLDGNLHPRMTEPVVSRLRLPRALCLDGDGHLVMSLAGEDGLRVYSPGGALLVRIPASLAGMRPRLVRALGPERLCIEDGTAAAPRLLAYRPEPGVPAAATVQGGGTRP